MLQQGLTNPQIAERLGISLDGAKYHVSEILGKLGVTKRDDAAIWSPGRRTWWAAAFAPIAGVWRRAGSALSTHQSAIGVATAAALAFVVAGGLGFLAYTLLRNGDGDSSVPVGVSTPVPGDAFGLTAFAGELDQALQSGDQQFFIDNVSYRDVFCGDAQGPPGYPRGCAGLPTGATAQGLPTSVLQSEGTYYDPAQYGELVQAVFKNGSPRLFAIATRGEPLDTDFERADEFERRAVAIVADGPSDGGEVLYQGALVVAFSIGYDGASWHVSHLTLDSTGALLDYEDPAPNNEWVQTYFGTWTRWGR